MGRLLSQGYQQDSRPELFSYDELVKLGSPQELSPELAAKLDALTTTPFINNEAFYRGAGPHSLQVEGLGATLRIVFGI